MDLDPYRTTCEVCLSDNICAGFEMIAPRTEVWICEKCCKDFSKKIQRKKMGLIISRGGESTQKGVVKKTQIECFHERLSLDHYHRTNYILCASINSCNECHEFKGKRSLLLE